MSAFQNPASISFIERLKKPGKPHTSKNRVTVNACCPAHDDRSPSLVFTETHDGKPLIRCQAGCLANDVLASVGMCWADWYAERGGLPKRQQKPLKAGHALSALAEQLAFALTEAIVIFNDLMPSGESPERGRLCEISHLLGMVAEEMRRASK